MPTLETIIERYPGETFMKADGLDEAIIGVDEETMRLIYSEAKVIEILKQDMPEDNDAVEFYEFNIKGAGMGEKTPIWCSDRF